MKGYLTDQTKLVQVYNMLHIAASISGVTGILPDELFHAMRDSEAEQNLEPSLLMTIVLSSHKGDPFSIFLFRDFLAGRTLRSSVLWNSKIWRHHSRFLMTKLMGIASTVNLPPGTAQDCQEQGRQCSEAHTDRIRPACACKLHHPVCTRLSISTGEESL